MTGSFSSAGMLGEFSALDGSVEFYGRVNAFLEPQFIVVDLGAGRGGWFADDEISGYQRSLRALKGKVSQVVGIDVDDAVLSNASTDVNFVMQQGRLPLPDASADVVIADFVLEHLGNPEAIETEVHRVLRAGGLFCGRTPHVLNYVSVGSRFVRRRRRTSVLKTAQPFRKEADVFETNYGCNTLRRLRRIWDATRWTSYSYLYTAEPSYDFGSSFVYRLLQVCHKVLPAPLVGNIFVFEVKR